MGIEIDQSTKPGVLGLFAYAEENRFPFEGTQLQRCDVCTRTRGLGRARSTHPSLTVMSENINKSLSLIYLQVITRQLLKHSKKTMSLSSGCFQKHWGKLS